MRSHGVLVLVTLLGFLLTNQLNQVNAKEDVTVSGLRELDSAEVDPIAEKQDSVPQEELEAQNEEAAAVGLQQEIQGTPDAEKLQNLFWGWRQRYNRIIWNLRRINQRLKLASQASQKYQPAADLASQASQTVNQRFCGLSCSAQVLFLVCGTIAIVNKQLYQVLRILSSPY
ncbi:hypothetical protein J4Q44_G00385730 [Coregonus suidteri]|uniref:Uncharacterized protein n=1 Tax=Coregonus suidteri TaxID=861788 RepID=A0AAN8K9X0_9TELE